MKSTHSFPAAATDRGRQFPKASTGAESQVRPSPGEPLQGALAQALGLTGLSAGLIRRLDPGTGELSAIASAGVCPELLEGIRVLRLDDTASGIVEPAGGRAVALDLAGAGEAGAAWRRAGFRTLVSAPLTCNGMLLGVISLAAADREPPCPRVIELLEAMAPQIACVMASGELYAAARRRIDELSRLNWATHDLSAATDPPAVLPLAAERMRDLLDLERTAVLEFRPESEDLVVRAGAGIEADGLEGIRVPAGKTSPARRALDEGNPVLVCAPHLQELGLPLRRLFDSDRLLAVPLIARGCRVGLLVGDRGRRPLRFSADEMDLAVIFAHHAAMSIENARYLQRSQESRARAEAAEAKFRGLLESAPDAIVTVDADGRIALINTQTEAMFGYGRDELLGLPVECLLPERFRSAHVAHRAVYMGEPHTRPMGSGLDLLARRKDGSEFPVMISLSPVRTAEGTLITSIIRDITPLRDAQRERLRLLESERTKSEQLAMAVREAHHRIKNNLQAVSDLLYLELHAGGGGPVGADVLKDSVERIQAIALVHDFLSHEEDVRVADMRAVIERLVPMVLTGSGSEAGQIEVSIRVPVLALSSKRATALALIVNELVSNAAKYAFRARRSGRLDVTLGEEGEELVLRVQDDGPGLPAGFNLDTHSRVGLDVVRVLAQRDLAGTLAVYGGGGLTAEVRFPW